MSGLPAEFLLSPNRAEEMDYDVWKAFVLPSFYDSSDLKQLKKPRVIIGGRGCGKTMLLRYLSHETAFSRRRQTIPKHEVDHIGLYWRVDTQFSALLTARGIPDDVWLAAFQHLAALVVGTEVLRSCLSIAESTYEFVSADDVERLDFKRLEPFDADLIGNRGEVATALETKLWTFQTWANNVRTAAMPTFYPGATFLRALVGEIRRQVPGLAMANYFVYLDEYENLLPEQQRIVNTWLKHSEVPLIFNVATKRNGMETRATVGPESIVDIHDFRQYDIEKLETNFDVFAAEVLFMRLGGANAPVDIDALRDPGAVRGRRNDKYVAMVRRAGQELFPQDSLEAIAATVVGDHSLERKLLERIARALQRRRSGLAAATFIDAAHPAASMIMPALLSRRGLAPEEVLAQLGQLQQGRQNRFTGVTGWVHNNLFAAILQLYDPLGRPCPVYAGFGRFVMMAKNNIRHFLELCHKAQERAASLGESLEDGISTRAQAEAARLASAALVAEIKSFGRKGNALHAFTLRLGALFSLAHQRVSLSEPEQNHFTIVRGRADLTEDAQTLLREAVKWSILFEEEGTKKKAATEPDAVDYVLNPVYAPYFHISYRKKRRLEFSSDQFLVLAAGTYDDVRDLTTRFARRWQIEGSEAVPPLFGHLLERLT